MRHLLPLAALALAGCLNPYYGTRGGPGSGDPPVAREEVERLAAAGVSDAVILESLERRGARKLSADDLVALKKAGATDAVLEKMIAAERPDLPAAGRAEAYYSHAHHHGYSCCSWFWPSVGFSYGWWGRRSGWGLHFGW
jgi:hypothetical protein